MILTCGLPGSGKTTWANEYVKKNPEVINANRDDLRKMLFNAYVLDAEQESTVTSVQHGIIRDALRKGKTVIVSDTNLNPRTVKSLHKIAEHFGAGFELVHISASAQESVVQDMNRKPEPARLVGAQVINNFAKNALDEKGIPKVLNKDWSLTEFVPKPYKPGGMMPCAIIVDLDGTVAIHQRSPYAYDLLETDLPNHDVIDVVKTYSIEGTEIIFMSGRPDTYKLMSKVWIDKHIGIDSYQIYMRKAGDSRMDAIVKEELFLEHVDGKYDVLFCLDDRDQVVKLWRDKGLTCLQVNYGNF